VTLRYFAPNGFFAEIGATLVWQDRTDAYQLEPESIVSYPPERLTTVDTVIGYRLPKRLGILSLAVCNLLDEEFRIQDVAFKSDDSFVNYSSILPGRMVLARLTLSF
jgi:hypothetical protein